MLGNKGMLTKTAAGVVDLCKNQELGWRSGLSFPNNPKVAFSFPLQMARTTITNASLFATFLASLIVRKFTIKK
jgi:hypothetical protein